MLDQRRPICAVIELARQESVLSAFHGHTNTTIDVELYEERSRDPEWKDRSDLADSCIVESCEAEWTDEEVRNDLNIPTYLRCMEPAVYWIQIDNCIGGIRHYCQFHRPRIRNV